MNHVNKSKEELLKEITRLHERISHLEKTETGRLSAEQAGKKVEEALRQSEERFRVILENSPIVLFSQDQELRYTWIYNPHPGFDPKAILGKTDAEMLPVEDATRLTEIKRHVLETGVAAREEVQTTIDGQVYFYDLVVEPLRDASGTITGVNCASIDITNRRDAEAKIKESEEKFRNQKKNSGIFLNLQMTA